MSQSPPGPAAGPRAPKDSREPPPGCCWRIDDLARRAEVTVDTIRYYQREGLLPAAERAGRANLYGPAHLERLERIKELQTRRFSLAAIRALVDEQNQTLVEGIFGGVGGRTYTLDELVERSGIAPDLVDAVRASGLLRDPSEYGRAAYDGDDLELLRVLAELHAIGIPRKAVVEMARTYASGVEATQSRIVELFTTGGDLAWSGTELADFRAASAGHATELLPLTRRLVDYAHQRTIQRLTLGAIERGAIPPPPAEESSGRPK